MSWIVPNKKGKNTYYELWDNQKFVKHIGNAQKLAKFMESSKDGQQLAEILKQRPDLISTMGNAPMRVFAAHHNQNLKKVTQPIPEGDIYYADPPWKYDFAETINREIENQYPTMELADIIKLREIMQTPDDCALFLWATAPKLTEAIAVMEGWGFNYKTNAVWDKEKIGMGYWFRGQHELLLVGTKGNFSPPRQEVRRTSVIKETRTEHSKKPPAIHDNIEAMFPGMRYVEIFCREKYNDKWLVWGNEC